MNEQPTTQSPYGAYTLSTEQKQPPAPVTPAQRKLLLGAAAIGLLFQTTIFDGLEQQQVFNCLYPAFWALYLILFHVCCWQQAKARPIALPFAAAALFLCIMMPFQARGYSDGTLAVLNILLVPALLMLHAQAVMVPLPPQGEAGYVPLFFRGFFAQPFLYLPRFFAAIASLFRKGGKRRMVWVGLLIALPLAGVVLSLLLSADAVMRHFAHNIFQDIALGEYLIRAFFFAIAAALFYSFLYGAAFARPAPAAYHLPTWGPTAPRIVLGTLLVIYAVFTGVQFLYLFGGYGLPAELTYSAYAREGFWQLIWVAGINLALFGTCLSRVQEDKLLRGLLLALLCCTGVILASAYTRLWLYVEAYAFQMTLRRIQAFWMLGYISMVILLCGVRLFKKKLPLLRWSAVLLALWYAALNIPNLNLWY